MPFVRAGAAAKLPPGSMMEFHCGERQVAICNVKGQIHAVENNCPHAGGPLAQGALHDDMIVCPWHAWEFSAVTGEHDYNPSCKVDVYPVKVEDGEILVDLPA